MEGHHNHPMTLGRLALQSGVPTFTGLRESTASNTNRQYRCSLSRRRCGGSNCTYVLARSQPTRRGRQRNGEEVKATGSVAGHLFLVQHANAGLGQPRTQKQIDVASRIGHSPGLTTRRAVRYGGSSARRAQDRLCCGVDYRVHHPVRRGREALRQAQSYGCAVVVRGFRHLVIVIVLVLVLAFPLPPFAALNWSLRGLGTSVEGILEMMAHRHNS